MRRIVTKMKEGSYEKSIQTFEKTEFLMLRFLHVFIKIKKGEEN